MAAEPGRGGTPGRTVRVVLGGYLLWVVTWYLAQLAAQTWGEPGRTWSLTLFMVAYEALAGVALALVIGRREGLFAAAEPAPFARTAAPAPALPARVGGVVAFAVALLVALVGSGALAALVADPPDLATVGKYLMLFPGMAMAVTLYCFVLIPRAVQRAVGPGPWGTTLGAVAGALAVGLGFWADQLLGDPALALVQAGVGLAVALGALLTGSIRGTYLVYLVIMLVNTLEEDRYGGFPWLPLMVGAAVVAAMSVFGGISRRPAPQAAQVRDAEREPVLPGLR